MPSSPAFTTTTSTTAAGRAAPLLIPSLLACYLIWGSTYLALHAALESFPPFFQMGIRFLVAGSLQMTWVVARGQRLPGLREWRNALAVGTLMLGGGMGLTAMAATQVGSGLVATFIAVVPMMVCGWGLLFGLRPRRLEVAGMAVGLVGVGLLARGASFSAAPVGVACLAGACVTWSLGSVLSTTRLPLARGPAGFASQMLCGGTVLMLASLALGERFAWPPTPLAVAALVYLLVFGTLIGFSAYLYLLAHASPALATSYAFVNPLIALLLGVGVGGEVVTPAEWGASGVVLLGVVLILLAGRKASPR